MTRSKGLSPHLVLATFTVRTATECAIHPDGWDFVRVAGGVGYLLQRAGPKELNPGEVVIVRGSEAVSFRASQLGSLVLSRFQVDLDQLRGVLSPADLRRLDGLAADRRLDSRHLPPEHEVSRLFAELCDAVGSATAIGLRCRMIEVFGLAAAEDLGGHAVPVQPSAPARDRLLKLFGEMSEAELLSQHPATLARQCGCSERHFNRLFGEYFGHSVRSKQIELRLSKAQQILRESDTKIVDVANECGYRRLSLFNAVFKQYFGISPRQYRSQHRSQAGKRSKWVVASMAAG
jgi:AraC-like DNA-binding protein